MKYSELKTIKSPKILIEAIKLFGTREIVGPQHNPVIISWAEELGLKKVYTADEIPWCGLFIGICVKKAGKEIVKNPLWARDWSNWGTKTDVAMLGDVLVFSRGSGGHVGLYVGEDAKAYHVLGGNQGNQVSVVRIDKKRCIAIRRTTWTAAQPKEVKQVFLDAKGNLSTNEV
jgi:uncharacterized protein (TIGR02594 family)